MGVHISGRTSPVMCILKVGEEFIGGDVHCASDIMGKLQPQCQVYLGQYPCCKDERRWVFAGWLN